MKILNQLRVNQVVSGGIQDPVPQREIDENSMLVLEPSIKWHKNVVDPREKTTNTSWFLNVAMKPYETMGFVG